LSVRDRNRKHYSRTLRVQPQRQTSLSRRHDLMNMIEKILAKPSGKKEVTPGEVVIANVDLMVMHDLSANFVTRVFREELEGGSILDPSRIAFVFDHNFSPATEEAARTLHKVRQFALQHGITNLFNG